jgi:hypothetical protein
VIVLALRRSLVVALVAAFVAGAGVVVQEFRETRGDQATPEPASQEQSSQVAAAPTATPAPKWSTRRLDIPSDLGVWSIRISPDGTALAGLVPKTAFTVTCPDKTSPCSSPSPVRAVRYAVADPPGAITATLTRVADVPQNGGFAWLPDGGLVVAALDLVSPGAGAGPKTYTVTIVEATGGTTSLGSLEASSVPATSLSPDGRWLAVAETQPPQLRFIDRHSGSGRTVALGEFGLPVTVAWAADSRLLFGKDSTLLRISTSGAIDRVAGPAGARLAGVESI